MTLKTGYALTQHNDAVVVSRSGTERKLAINHVPIRVTKGFDTELTFSIRNDNRLPVNLNSAAISATMITRRDNIPQWKRNLRILDPADGVAQLVISKADAQRLEDDVYYLVLTMNTSDDISVPLYSDDRYKTRFVVNVDTDSDIEIAKTEVVDIFYVTDTSYLQSQRIPSSAQNPTSSGLHTAAIYSTDFTGKITVEATLAVDPADVDWFVIDDPTGIGVTELSDVTGITPIAFDGRFYWVRFRIDTDSGSVDKILYRS